MPLRIYRSLYKDVRAVTLENECLKVQFLPENGGKMASLVKKPQGRECLVQAGGQTYRRLRYDGDFVSSECSGFDDLFPTIGRSYCAGFPWEGTELPDHGEVCSLEWDADILQDALSLQVYGVRFPYRLEKQVRLEENTVRIRYRAVNLSGFDMDFIYAAHLMLNYREGGELSVPFEAGRSAECMFSEDRGFARYGDRITWPEFIRSDGKRQVLNRLPAEIEHPNAYKYYFMGKAPSGNCEYRCRDGGGVKLGFSAETLPYLGIWVNEGPFKGYRSVALEPCTAPYDRPDIAKMHGLPSVLPARGEYAWELSVGLL